MKDLLISQTDDSPEINFKTNGELSLKGVSIPENVSKFYSPIYEWLDELQKDLPKNITLTFEIEYINTSTSRAFIDISRKIAAFKGLGKNAKVVWHYAEEDEDNFELGKDLEYSAKFEFVFEPI